MKVCNSCLCPNKRSDITSPFTLVIDNYRIVFVPISFDRKCHRNGFVFIGQELVKIVVKRWKQKKIVTIHFQFVEVIIASVLSDIIAFEHYFTSFLLLLLLSLFENPSLGPAKPKPRVCTLLDCFDRC
jgi:hypothetical protein